MRFSKATVKSLAFVAAYLANLYRVGSDTVCPVPLTALDHACVRGAAPVRPDRRDPFLRLHHVGSHCEHRTALWDLLPHALGGQPVRGVPHRLTQVRL